MAVAYHLLTGGEIPAIREEIIRVYASAWGLHGEEGEAWAAWFGREVLDRHATRPGFRCCIARDGESGALLGFVYGYPGGPGMWWYDRVAPALAPEVRERWLASYFEFVELAVAAEAKRQGIGGRLHDLILQDLPYPTAALSTLRAETPAMALYRKRGWVTLLDHYRFPDGDTPYRIMGLDLRRFHP